MDASQELALFRDIDFSVAPSTADGESERTRLNIAKSESFRKQAKTQQNRKKKIMVWNLFLEIKSTYSELIIFPLQRNAVAQNTQSQLDPNELLFFTEHLNVCPSDETASTAEEMHREQMYKLKIGKMSDTERRQSRAKRDIRYLHIQNNVPMASESPPADLPCLHHVGGKCEHKVCIYNHQMRLPRQFGVCRFYLMNACTKGNACTHMHSEFPCKFFYLNMPHPKNIDADNCRFTHGDVLNENTKRFFLKQIEFWVKEKTAGDTGDFERQMNEMIARFEEQEQKMMSERHRKPETGKSNKSNAVDVATCSTVKTFALSEILNEAQIRRLADDNITSMERLRQMSVAELENYRLTIDQIYEIKSKRFKVVHSTLDEDRKCVTESNQNALLSPAVGYGSLDRQNYEVQGVDDAIENGDKNETQSLDRYPLVEKQIEDECDDSDSDGENRLVISDEFL